MQAALRKMKKSKADQTKWRKFKSKLKVLKAKGLRNSRLLLGLRAPQEDTVHQGEVPETMLVAVEDEPMPFRFIPAEVSGIAKMMPAFSGASEGESPSPNLSILV